MEESAIAACEAALLHSTTNELADWLWDEFSNGKDVRFEKTNVHELRWESNIRTDDASLAGTPSSGTRYLVEDEYVIYQWLVGGVEVCRYEGSEIPLREPSTCRPSVQVSLLPGQQVVGEKNQNRWFEDAAYLVCKRRNIDPDTLLPLSP